MDEHNKLFLEELKTGSALDYFVENKELFSRSELEIIIETYLLLYFKPDTRDEIIKELIVRFNGKY